MSTDFLCRFDTILVESQYKDQNLKLDLYI